MGIVGTSLLLSRLELGAVVVADTVDDPGCVVALLMSSGRELGAALVVDTEDNELDTAVAAGIVDTLGRAGASLMFPGREWEADVGAWTIDNPVLPLHLSTCSKYLLFIYPVATLNALLQMLQCMILNFFFLIDLGCVWSKFIGADDVFGPLYVVDADAAGP